MTLIRGLAVLVEQTEHTHLSKVIADVRSQVERGVSLSAALSAHPKVFSRLYVAMVRAGEAWGRWIKPSFRWPTRSKSRSS